MLTTDWDFSAAVIQRLGIHPGGQLLASLTSDDAATLYLWLGRRVEKPVYEPRRVYDVNSLQEFPSTVLHVIGGREDADACAALERIAVATGSRGLRGYASRTEHAAHAATWQPILLADLRAVAADASRRVIRTSQQLAVVVSEALAEFGKQLRTDATVRRRYWDCQLSGCYAPLDEEAISDELRIELATRLGHVVVHREVRIEPRIGKQPASEVDLLNVSGDDVAASCIVEVKCNWYPRLVENVQLQLVDRYLKGPEGDFGVFLVMWFAGHGWCGTDSRRKGALKDRTRLVRRLNMAVADSDGHASGVVLDCTLEQHA